jgi:hypothetical protein
MVAVLEKLLPFTVSTNAGPPEFMLFGARAAIAGIAPAVGGVAALEL